MKEDGDITEGKEEPVPLDEHAYDNNSLQEEFDDPE